MTSSPQVRPLGELLGTEALGIDLSRPLDEMTFAWIGRVFAEHPVLVFRDQNLGAAELAAFGRRFGSPRLHALVKYRHAEYPEVSWLTNVEDDGKVDWYGVKRATDWHTDSTYEADPPILAILHAKEIPSSKGGTMFADMRAAALFCGVIRDARRRSKPTCSYSARLRNVNNLRNRASSRAPRCAEDEGRDTVGMIGCEHLRNGTAGRMSDQMHAVETQVIDEPQRVRGPTGPCSRPPRHDRKSRLGMQRKRRQPVPSSRCHVRQGPPRTRWVDLRRKRHRTAFRHRS